MTVFWVNNCSANKFFLYMCRFFCTKSFMFSLGNFSVMLPLSSSRLYSLMSCYTFKTYWARSSVLADEEVLCIVNCRMLSLWHVFFLRSCSYCCLSRIWSNETRNCTISKCVIEDKWRWMTDHSMKASIAVGWKAKEKEQQCHWRKR